MTLGKTQRELISRLAMAVVALLLFRASFACFRTDRALAADAAAYLREHPTATRAPYSPLPFFISILLAVLGLPFALGALLPPGLLYKLPFLSNPSATIDVDSDRFRGYY
jgi:hypothetical protein